MKKVILLIVLVCILTSPVLGAWTINNRNVSNPILLRKLLDDRIGTLDTNITTLNNATPGINSIGTGSIFYVDSVSGSNGGATTWATAKTTLDAAIALCTDGNHDVIYVASEHAETLAADITLDINDITIIGIGSGPAMPEITFTDIGDSIIIDAYGVTVYKLRLIAGIADVTACFTLADESDYASIISCEFPEPGTATFEFARVFQMVTGADNVTLAYNTIINQGATPGMVSVIDGGAAAIDSLTIVNNYVNADCSVTALYFSDQADTNLFIVDNVVIQEDIDQFCIELTSTATGIIKGNSYGNLGGVAYLVDPGSCFQQGNIASTAIDQAGFEWPGSTNSTQCAYVEPASIAAVTNLFQVTGGPIIIRDIVGVVTSDIIATGCLINYNIDPVEPATDTVFGTDTTALEINGDAAGSTYIWDGVLANDLTVQTLGVAVTRGIGDIADGLLCPQGMIELAATATNAGVIAFYMTYDKLSPNSMVTPQ